MKRRWISIAVLLTALQTLSAQENLVYNPSFETYRNCPQRIDALGVMNDVEAWWQPTSGSSDYFNSCGGRDCCVPRNKMGIQDPHEGNAYCGIYCSQENYREYLQTELKQPLLKGIRYKISFYVSLSDKAPHAIGTMGALFTKERITDTSRGILMHRESINLSNGNTQSIATLFTPQIENDASNTLDNPKEWTLISGEFTAEGGERFMTIGNFNSFNHSGVVDLQNNSAVLPGAYYYIDDVSVVGQTIPQTDTTTTIQAIEQGDVFTLHEVYFETGKSELLQQSFKELAQLIALLRKNPSIRIEIRGHTDNQGTIEFNQHLSEQRAKAVVDYLTANGIDPTRLTWNGYGKSQPVDDNNTPEGRQRNRRVEYKVIEK